MAKSKKTSFPDTGEKPVEVGASVKVEIPSKTNINKGNTTLKEDSNWYNISFGKEVKLDLPPALNGLYRAGIVNGRPMVYKVKEAKKYAEYIKWRLSAIKPQDGNVRLYLNFFFGRDRDIDSGLKVLLDALNDVIYYDDKQITELFVLKHKAGKDILPHVLLRYCFLQGSPKDIDDNSSP